MTAYNKPDNLFEWSFPSNHLLKISLVRENRNPNQPYSGKAFHFFFLNIIPGTSTSENSFGKTYDMTQRYAIKFTITEMFGFANALKYAAAGSLINMYGGWQKIANYNNTKKFLGLNEKAPDQKSKVRTVFLTYSQIPGDVKMSVVIQSDICVGISEIIREMCIRATRAELNLLETLPKTYNTDNKFIEQQTTRPSFDSPQPPQGEFYEGPPQSHSNVFGNQDLNSSDNEGINPFATLSTDFESLMLSNI